MSDLLRRLEALEAARNAASARVRTFETAAERADVLHSYIWNLYVFDDRCRTLAPDGDGGYWPYIPLKYGATTQVLRVDALQPIYDATRDEIVEMMLTWVERLAAPVEGGEVPFFFEEGDTEPFVRFWFPPCDGVDLL
ncbi:hypothetical protein [Paraburkholderia diazotrophica]|uniref:Uncharacterized protein n=1 Tax=Paraburkholderia diazotrophica TaxID=667676 RepID=A0A1H6UVC8_9BURK|nr:hypothetical protein [Paraburkholderia diazotrophica]SEI96218.1 hypothetical protein SAMN05192539_1005209 [Paraburkholderia diazotrophica]